MRTSSAFVFNNLVPPGLIPHLAVGVITEENPMKKQILCLALILIFTTSAVSFRNVSASGPTTPSPASLSEQLGAFIIIAGARSDFALQNLINYGCDQVYSIVTTNLGFPADRVYYLGPTVGDPTRPNVQAVSKLGNIADTIENWAKSRVDSSHGLGSPCSTTGVRTSCAFQGGFLQTGNCRVI